MSSTRDRPPDRPVTLLLAHSEGLVRQALAEMLVGRGFRVSHEVESLQALYGAAQEDGGRTIDLLLVESDLLGSDPQYLEQISHSAPVVLLVRPGGAEEQAPLLRPGVSGSLSLNLDGDHFAQSLHLLVRGDIVVSGDIAAAAGDLDVQAERYNDHPLTEREQEVVSLVATGATNREIADTLIITEHTVKVHLSHILEKLNLRNRQQAAAWAVRNGLVDHEGPVQDAGAADANSA